MQTKILIKLVIFSLNDEELNIYFSGKNLPYINLAENDGLDLIAEKFLRKVFNPPSRKSPIVRSWDAETFFRFGWISAPDKAHY